MKDSRSYPHRNLTAEEALDVVEAWLVTLPEGIEAAQFEAKRDLFVTGLLAGDLRIELTPVVKPTAPKGN